MRLVTWLENINKGIDVIGPDHAMREFVCGLHKRNMLYHFDDDAHEIINGRTGEMLFTSEEANLCNAIVSSLHCEEMFILALQLNEDES